MAFETAMVADVVVASAVDEEVVEEGTVSDGVGVGVGLDEYKVEVALYVLSIRTLLSSSRSTRYPPSSSLDLPLPDDPMGNTCLSSRSLDLELLDLVSPVSIT